MCSSLCLCERRSFASDAAIWSLTNVITYNAAIDARADRRAEIWLHWMEEAAVAKPQLEPDAVSYSSVKDVASGIWYLASDAAIWSLTSRLAVRSRIPPDEGC
jgi:hypothetical protein